MYQYCKALLNEAPYLISIHTHFVVTKICKYCEPMIVICSVDLLQPIISLCSITHRSTALKVVCVCISGRSSHICFPVVTTEHRTFQNSIDRGTFRFVYCYLFALSFIFDKTPVHLIINLREHASRFIRKGYWYILSLKYQSVTVHR